MIFALMAILVLVGVAGYEWAEVQILREKLTDQEYINWDLTAELEPIEINLRDDEGE